MLSRFRPLALGLALMSCATLVAAATPVAAASSLGPGHHLASRHGTITGIVTGTHGHPLAGICIRGVTGLRKEPATNAHGVYRFSVRPGNYRFFFSPGCGNTANWVWQLADEGKLPRKPIIKVKAGQTVRVNARLIMGGSVTGKVTGRAGKLLSGVCVNLLQPQRKHYVPSLNFFEGPIITTGKPFTFTSVIPGRYRVQFQITTCGNTSNYANQYWHSAVKIGQARVVTVRPGHAITGIDQRLPAGAIITGEVTGQGGVPLANVCVDVSGTGWYPNPLDIVSTGKNGDYRAIALTTGKYDVYFDPTCNSLNPGYAAQDYGQPVPVTDGKTTAGISATLSTGS